MKPKSLWRLAVAGSAGAEEEIGELLSAHFGVPYVAYTDAESRQTEVFVYLEEKPASAAIDRLATTLQAALKCGSVIQLQRVKREDWAESWKKHFKPLRLGRALLIKPSWDQTQPVPGQVTVILDPGLSFGTGQHPTTAFCLRQIVAYHRLGGGTFLDIGTGSGILAIAAARLGFPVVCAWDNDAEAIRVARANAKLNEVPRRIQFREADLGERPTKGGQKFNLVCANLAHDLLISEQTRIGNCVLPRGWLVLAGILVEQFESVRAVYERAGFRLRQTTVRNEWQSGLFVRV